jgi:redox-sensitive bicupin YhaK (pirin superfamily)
MDPFLLLDHFGSDDPDDYLAGFPWHPHRGIETITYMIEGVVEHGDSLGTRGAVGDIVIDPTYLDVAMPPEASLELPVRPGHTAFAFVLEGAVFFDEEKSRQIEAIHLALFGEGDWVSVSTCNAPVKRCKRSPGLSYRPSSRAQL